jgi:mannan endo-1,4-beta-mannosidase
LALWGLLAAACRGRGVNTGKPPAPPVTSGPPTTAVPGSSTSVGPTSSLPPTPTVAEGQFTVSGPDILAPDGKPFIPVGTNMNGPNSFFDVATKGRAGGLKAQWGFNTIRLVTCLPTGCQGQLQTVNNDLDGIVAEYTSQRLVVMIDYHQLGFGEAATPADVDAAVGFWRATAERFKDNPYVWFNLFNEPDASFNDGKLGSTAPQRWRAQHQPVIDAIRGTGATNLLVIDDTQAGMGAADFWDIGPSPAGQSATLTEGPKLLDPAHRLVFSVHAYDAWGYPNDGSDDCANRYTDAQRDARFRSYVDRVHALGFPLLVGEVGFRATDQPASGVSYHGEGGGQPPCGSTMLLAAETVYRVAPLTRLGVIVWHGFDLTTDGGQAWDVTGSPPTNLTAFGRLQWDYAQRLAGR